MNQEPVLAFSQGDPAGVGPELLLRLAARWLKQVENGDCPPYRLLLVAERCALEAHGKTLEPAVVESVLSRLAYCRSLGECESADRERRIPVLVPQSDALDAARTVLPGQPTPQDARAALLVLERTVKALEAGSAQAMITLPVNKAEIASHVDQSFRGHTDWLAKRAGLEEYGRDYLMAFLLADLRVALLSTHVSLREALARIDEGAIVSALLLMARHVDGPIAVAGLNPHAGEGGLMGREEAEVLTPAIARARTAGVPVVGPESPDTVFLRARCGEFAWVLALYHDQGLIAVKTLGFGEGTNWSMGLPWVRTSVDHGTAYGIAGHGKADATSLETAVETTLQLLR